MKVKTSSLLKGNIFVNEKKVKVTLTYKLYATLRHSKMYLHNIVSEIGWICVGDNYAPELLFVYEVKCLGQCHNESKLVCTVPLTYSFTRYANDIRTIIDIYYIYERHTIYVLFWYTIRYWLELDRMRNTTVFCYVYMPNYRDFFTEPYSVVICLISPVR